MAWVYLFIAGLFEVAWAVGLKYTEGFTKLWPSLWTLGAMSVSIYLLARAVETLPIGTAYAVWTGIGAAGTVVMGLLFFKEPAHWFRLCCVVLIISGIVGLKLFDHWAATGRI